MLFLIYPNYPKKPTNAPTIKESLFSLEFQNPTDASDDVQYSTQTLQAKIDELTGQVVSFFSSSNNENY